MKVHMMLAGKGRGVFTTPPDSTIETAIGAMKAERIGALVVTGKDETVLGIITERDVLLGLADHGAVILVMPVAEIMTTPVKSCTPDANVQDVMAEMTRHRFRHMPVIEDGKLCGMISIGDLVKNRLEELESETSVLRDYIVGRA